MDNENKQHRQETLDHSISLYRLGYLLEAHELMAGLGYTPEETTRILSRESINLPKRN